MSRSSLQLSENSLVHVEPLALDRYLVPFSFRQVPLLVDVVVVGGGAAGRAALAPRSRALPWRCSPRPVSTRRTRSTLRAAWRPSCLPRDSVESHVTDTLRVGCGLSERSVVLEVVQGGPQAVEHLLWLGAEFDRGADGGLRLSRE